MLCSSSVPPMPSGGLTALILCTPLFITSMQLIKPCKLMAVRSKGYHGVLQIRIDHGARCIHFGMDLSESQREDKPEGPTLQSMPSEQVRNQLVNMATVLHRAMATINPNKKRVSIMHAQLVASSLIGPGCR